MLDREESHPEDTLIVHEVGADTPDVLRQALSWVVKRAAERRRSRVRFIGPPDHPFSRLAYLQASAKVTTGPAAAGQVMITNRGLLMADLAQALSGRVQNAGLLSGMRLILDIATKRINLSYTEGRMRLLGGRAGRELEEPVTRLPVQVFTQLVTGYVGGDEIENFPRVTVAPAHRESLSVLFPRGYPKWIPAPYW